MPLNLDIAVPRNAHYSQDWQLKDNEGNPLDLSGDALELKVRAVAGQGAVIAAADIDVHDPANGIFTVTLAGSQFVGVQGQSETVRLAYDLRHTFSDGIKYIPVEGQILLTPGATY